MTRALAIAIAGSLLGTGASAADPTLARLATVELAPRGAEIVAFHRPAGRLLVTDAGHGEVHLLQVESWDPPRFTTVDAFPLTDSNLAIPVPGKPTGVAVHPSLPLAIVVTAPANPEERGFAVFLDLREKSPGRVLRTQPVGYHPASVAISPDGRWAIVANEGQDSDATPGTIGLLDLRNVEGWVDDRLAAVPYLEPGGLDHLLGRPAGVIEPEFVAVDAASRVAAISCQDNDAVALLDLRADPPALAAVLPLPEGSAPDGVSLLDGFKGPGGQPGLLLAVAEEGKARQSVSFFWLDPELDAAPPLLLSRTDVRPLVNPARPGKRRDPEGILLLQQDGRTYAMVGIERGHRVLCLDATDASQPRLVGRVPTGPGPQGLIAIEQEDGWLIVTGDEGDGTGPGSLSVLRLRKAP